MSICSCLIVSSLIFLYSPSGEEGSSVAIDDFEVFSVTVAGSGEVLTIKKICNKFIINVNKIYKLLLFLIFNYKGHFSIS